ncbi:transglutaminase-like domain-containing protein [Bernardetia sp. Wsw4-3y2]|uniref:transglutaminase-like domain-containing protein n=1 Tax=Bernardetia sp. Wsw4-3y2 TaxID=3127471 RepID=UPI0030D31904
MNKGYAEYNAKRDLYIPSYRQLSNYSHLINMSKNGFYVHSASDLPKTLARVAQIVENDNRQVSKLAQHLKADTHIQSAYNVWHFLKMNINYRKDTLGLEEIRDCERSYYDRRIGIDCEDFTVFAASLMLQMGYKASMYVVDYDNKNNEYDHIFAVTGEYIIDPVWSIFNEEPTSKKIEEKTLKYEFYTNRAR